MRDAFKFPFTLDDDFINSLPIPRKNMKTDVIELDDKYVLEVELPGYNKDDIKISIVDDILTIEASKSTETKKEGKQIMQERQSEKISRSFTFGRKLASEDVTASYDNGILKLEVMKEKEAEIPVNYIAIK